MQIQEVLDLVKDDIRLVEEGFEKNLSSNVSLIGDVGKYILNCGGKRLRPMLLLLCAKLSSYAGDKHIPLAGAIEFIHTATLLHDDVVDSAHLRRGNTTANMVWGDGTSILVGDYLLSKAFSLAVASGNEKILKVLAYTTTCMAEGEVLQLLKHRAIDMTEEECMEVVTNKTATLFAASAQIAGILCGVNLEREVALANYGMSFGIAYQLMDDCLDYVSTDKDLGKAVGNDLREGKMTMPLIHSYKEANDAEKLLLKEVFGSGELAGEKFNEVLAIINRYGGIDYTNSKARGYIDDAKGHIDIFEPVMEKMALIALADFVMDRTC